MCLRSHSSTSGLIVAFGNTNSYALPKINKILGQTNLVFKSVFVCVPCILVALESSTIEDSSKSFRIHKIKSWQRAVEVLASF